MFSSLYICLNFLLFADAQSVAANGGATVDEWSTRNARPIGTSVIFQNRLTRYALVSQQDQRLLITIKDENGVPVASARVILIKDETQIVPAGETDSTGRHTFIGLSPGRFRMRAEKQGFYAVKLDEVLVGQTESLEITLNHEQELRESVDVTNSPPAIDPAKTTSNETLSSREINNIPYPTMRDFRNVLPFLPRVHRGTAGQVHINGSESYQVLYQLDGFNVSHPASGLLEVRVSPDALRSIEVQGSRYSAEYGKASGGVLNLTTGMGDDRFRITGTDFVPSFQFLRGFTLNSWTPRVTFSGPLQKTRGWFFTTADAEVNLDIRTDLPKGADRNGAWRLNTLAKAQVNLSHTNLLNIGFLVNQFHSEYAGLSRLTPQGTAPELQQNAYLFTLRNQIFRANGLRVEAGFAASQFRADTLPHGSLPYQISPEAARGSFFKRSELLARRLQWIMNLALPQAQWHGRHEVKLGADVNHIDYKRFLLRSPIQILRTEGTLSRQINFDGAPQANRDNLELGGYVQDRWAISNRLLVELGLRLDRDEIIRQMLVSPRLAASTLLTRDGETRLALGIGLFHDATNPDFITRPLEGRRVDLFYAKDGKTLARQSMQTAFIVNEQNLKAPRYINWSVELERKLPAEIYLRLEMLSKRGRNGFAFDQQGSAHPVQISSFIELGNTRNDRYDAFTITARRMFKENYSLFASYTRSSARTNAVLDYNLDTPFFSQQQGGPLDWDAPDRLISYGWMPLVKKFDLLYSLEWRSGYPFSIINADRKLEKEPNSQRFPTYFSLNLFTERRVRLLGLKLALRAGFNNVTDRQNPTDVNNVQGSSQFLRFAGVQGRAFNGRIRFLGRK